MVAQLGALALLLLFNAAVNAWMPSAIASLAILVASKSPYAAIYLGPLVGIAYQVAITGATPSLFH